MTTTIKSFFVAIHSDPFSSLLVSGSTQGRGIKPLSGASPRIKVVRLSDGEGEARRKAGLMECSESLLLLLLLNGGQGGATGWRGSCGKHPAEREGSEEAAAGPETSRSRGVVFGVAGGHSPWTSYEWTILSSTSLVL